MGRFTRIAKALVTPVCVGCGKALAVCDRECDEAAEADQLWSEIR